MSWQGEISTIVRSIINDLDSDSYTYSAERIETCILASAVMETLNVPFTNDYTISVETCTLDPDPTAAATKDDAFITLISLRTACMIIGSEIRSESGNAISIKDGPSAIDLRGVSKTLITFYRDLCDKYEQLVLDYRAGNSIAGQAVTGPIATENEYYRPVVHRNGMFN
jgi:hypothetical protein